MAWMVHTMVAAMADARLARLARVQSSGTYVDISRPARSQPVPGDSPSGAPAAPVDWREFVGDNGSTKDSVRCGRMLNLYAGAEGREQRPSRKAKGRSLHDA